MSIENDAVENFNTMMNIIGVNETGKTDFKISKENELILIYIELRLKLVQDSLKGEFFLNDFHPNLFKNDIKVKCNSSLNKSCLGQLFYILMDEGLLFFDLNDKVKNRSRMQEFLTGNFTYCGDSGNQIDMNSVSKQFSESKGYIYKEKQIMFLNELISIIEKRKERLVRW